MRGINKQERIVIAITSIILLIGYVSFTTPWVTEREPIVRTRVALSMARSAVLAYQQEYRVYPSSFGNLTSSGNDRHLAFLEDLKHLTDSWGQCIRLKSEADGFELRSAGPDGMFETEDDIVERAPKPPNQ